MRLWHIDLIPYLPKKQLQGQWRELNSIFKNQPNHILINYVYNYNKKFLFDYVCVLQGEFIKRGLRIKNYDNCANYFINMHYPVNAEEFNFKEHDDEYLTICYWNLREKYIRGQKDFDDKTWQKLDNFYKRRIMNEFKL